VTIPGETPADNPQPAAAPLFKGSLLGRVGRGTGALGFGGILNILSQVALVPVALRFWGEVRYGEWIVLSGVVLALKVTDLGLQVYVVNKMCIAYSRGQREAFQSFLHDAIRVQLWLGAGVIVGVAAALHILPVRHILNLNVASSGEAKLAMFLLATELVIGVPAGVLGGVYRSTGRLPRAAMIGAIQQSAMIISTLVLIALSSRFDVIAASRVAITTVFIVLTVFDVRRLYPWLSLSPRLGSFRSGLAFIGPGLLFLVIALSDFLSSQLLTLIVNARVGGSAVSQFVTLRTASNIGIMGGGLFLSAMWPEFTRLHGAGDQIGLRRALRSFAMIHLYIVGLVSILSVPLVAVLYGRWTSGVYRVDWTVFGLMSIRVIVWGAWSPALALLGAINKQHRVVLALILNALLTGAAAVPLVARYGIAGAAFANLLGDVATVAWMLPRDVSAEVGQSLRAYLRDTGRVLGGALGLPFLFALGAWATDTGVVTTSGVWTLAGLCSAAIMWRLIDIADRESALRLLRPMYLLRRKDKRSV